jgi:hypothetical protein
VFRTTKKWVVAIPLVAEFQSEHGRNDFNFTNEDVCVLTRVTMMGMSKARHALTRAMTILHGAGALTLCAAITCIPAANADNQRLNNGVYSNVYTIQSQAGCTTHVKKNAQLQQAAQWHALDVLNNRDLDGDIGSDGSSPQQRAEAAGFRGTVSETVATNPALAISGIEILGQWYYRPDYFAIMSNCANTAIGVWSENSPDRTVVVAVYGVPG